MKGYEPKPGEKFFYLTVIKKLKKKDSNGRTLWEFQCVCGKYIQRPISVVIAGFTRSCGCCYTKNERMFALEIDPELAGQSIKRMMSMDERTIEGYRKGLKLMEKDPLYKRAHENRMEISKIAKFAAEEGLSYGEHSKKYGIYIFMVKNMQICIPAHSTLHPIS